MVEQVEDFPAKLNQLRFSQLRSLNHREVGVVEPWTNYHVATEAAETSNRHYKRRNIKPAIRRAKDVDWTRIQQHRLLGD